jgi:hypothetical protein
MLFFSVYTESDPRLFTLSPEGNREEILEGFDRLAPLPLGSPALFDSCTFILLNSTLNAQIVPLFSTTSNMSFSQLLLFDIDTILPGGWGGTSRLVRSSTPREAHPCVQIASLFSTAYKLPFC